MDNLINNAEHNKEVVSQHSDVKKEEVKLPNTQQLRSSVNKSFAEVKSNLGFNRKGLENLTDTRSTISVLSKSLEIDDQAFRLNVVKSITTLISTEHKDFVKAFKAFKDQQSHIKPTFINDFFEDCKTKLSNEKTDGNVELQAQSKGDVFEVLKSKANTKEDLIFLIEMIPYLSKSASKQQEAVKKLKAKK